MSLQCINGTNHISKAISTSLCTNRTVKVTNNDRFWNSFQWRNYTTSPENPNILIQMQSMLSKKHWHTAGLYVQELVLLNLCTGLSPLSPFFLSSKSLCNRARCLLSMQPLTQTFHWGILHLQIYSKNQIVALTDFFLDSENIPRVNTMLLCKLKLKCIKACHSLGYQRHCSSGQGANEDI